MIVNTSRETLGESIEDPSRGGVTFLVKVNRRIVPCGAVKVEEGVPLVHLEHKSSWRELGINTTPMKQLSSFSRQSLQFWKSPSCSNEKLASTPSAPSQKLNVSFRQIQTNPTLEVGDFLTGAALYRRLCCKTRRDKPFNRRLDSATHCSCPRIVNHPHYPPTRPAPSSQPRHSFGNRRPAATVKA